MMTASRFANSTGVFAGIMEIAVVGYCLVKTMSAIRRRLLIWHQETAEPSNQQTRRMIELQVEASLASATFPYATICSQFSRSAAAIHASLKRARPTFKA